MGLFMMKGGKAFGVWSPELYEEMIMVDFRQEDLADGPNVASWLSRGIRPKTAVQATGADQPTKVADNGGVLFAKSSTQSLEWGVDTDAHQKHRAWVTISRCDIAGNPSQTEVPVVTINGTPTSNGNRQPYIHYICNLASYRSHIYDGGGSKTQSGAANTAATDKNIRIDYRRGRELHSRINGVKNAALEHFPMSKATASSSMGANSATTLKADVWIHRFMILQGELSEAYVDRLEGYLHWEEGMQAQLPSDHPYKNQRPLVTATSAAEDFPVLYEYDAAAWTDYANTPAVEKNVNRGGTPVALPGDYKTVFHDHFLSQTVADDTTGGARANWFGLGWNTGIGIMATQVAPSFSPSCYVHDTSELRLRLLYSSGWKLGNFHSVNLTGHGRWFAGPKYCEVRFKHVGRDGSDVEFPLTSPRVGFFTSPLWWYGARHLTWRTRNRIEFDGLEADGAGSFWYNGGSTHVHVGQINTYDAGGTILISGDVNDKIAGYNLQAAQGFTPDINLFEDGWITHATDIREDFVYLLINGKEAARAPTPHELLEPMYLCVSNGYDTPGHGAAGNTAYTYDIVMDYLTVSQPESYLATVPSGFSARPTIAGTAAEGNTLTVTPNTVGDQIEYWWYRDGNPLTDTGTTHLLVAGDVGGKIRCDVHNLDLVNQDNCWTAETATIT